MLTISVTGAPKGNLALAQAHWVARDTIAWKLQNVANNLYGLHYAPNGGLTTTPAGVVGGASIPLTYDPAGLSSAILAKFPHLAGYGALKIGASDLAQVPAILKGQIAIAATDGGGNPVDATALQIPGVLDDLYTFNGPLGVTFASAVPSLALWAPTAVLVTLHLFDNSTTAVSTSVPMTLDAATGVWSATGQPHWNGKYYLYEVQVFVRSTGKIETNLVTDPYSLSLSTNSLRSQIIDLTDPTLEPPNWNTLAKPPLAAPEDIVLYELHVRDFSVHDRTVPISEQGTFKAFTERNSDGMQHLQALAQAGLTHVHILPAFDCASVDENKATWQAPDEILLALLPPNSDAQQAAVKATRDLDGFNWCYDPFHYTVPEGSYSTNPDGPTRIREFREMVQSLNSIGLRVVMDVVYNHTSASGQDPKSVLDKVVPGYYHRLNGDGNIENSTCCQNTASEHAMMEKLMVDSLSIWARAYKVDGFRFDLMGHHMLSNMIKIRDTLHGIAPEIYLYGEGWDFGEVANNNRGVNATQLNLAGSGIGSFTDRMRDALRGAGPFERGQQRKKQGFINGLYVDPNGLDQGTADQQKDRLLLSMDQIRVGLTGNLKDYRFTDRTGATVTGAQVYFNGGPTGYTSDPQEVINYTEAHDNGTLFDAIQLSSPVTRTLDERIRMHELGIDVIALAQGVPFFQAGQELLRSKSFDGNSYNSGDWFNKLDWTYTDNNFGVGLPPDLDSDWPVFDPLLADAALKPNQQQILASLAHFEEMLRIRKSSSLFRLRTAAEVEQQVSFGNTGPTQIPGLLAMTLVETHTIHADNPFKRIVVVFNATTTTQTYVDATLKNAAFALHPVQAASADPVVRTASFDAATGSFSVPPRTTAVFVATERQVLLPIVAR